MHISLSPDECQVAHELWDSLMFARSTLQLEEAREALRCAPPAIKSAVMASIATLWAKGQEPTPQKNPFDPTTGTICR